ncbi:hypothetical protein L0244_37875 [bacterium]|nr:hypothetical protein [bacterium]
MTYSFAVARWILISVGILFLLSGLIVTSLYLAKVIPSGYNWQGPSFLVLGAIGFATAYFGLRVARTWPLIVLSLVYIPWTVIGLIGDTRQGFWPLAIGEALGLVVVLLALLNVGKQVADERK